MVSYASLTKNDEPQKPSWEHTQKRTTWTYIQFLYDQVINLFLYHIFKHYHKQLQTYWSQIVKQGTWDMHVSLCALHKTPAQLQYKCVTGLDATHQQKHKSINWSEAEKPVSGWNADQLLQVSCSSWLAGRTRTTDYIDPYVTHMNKKWPDHMKSLFQVSMLAKLASTLWTQK